MYRGCLSVVAFLAFYGQLAAQNESHEYHIVQGPGVVDSYPTFTCARTVNNYRGAAVGHVTSIDGYELTIPHISTAYNLGLGPLSYDLYNECSNIMPMDSSEVDINQVPVLTIDADGDLIEGYVVADNYYELYVNGHLVSVDNTPFTPFNSSLLRFRVKRPYTLAVLVIDWDEHLGLGMELFPQGPESDRLSSGNLWHTGDAGLMIKLSDGTRTDASWKVETFVIAPLDDPHEMDLPSGDRDTSHRGRSGRDFIKPRCASEASQEEGELRLYPRMASLQSECYAVYYRVPEGWMYPSFDDAHWPNASVYTDIEVGTTNLPAYNRYPKLFDDANWIWSKHLVLDNLVIARKNIR